MAFAQSTGSIVAEDEDGPAPTGVNGVIVPHSARAQGALDAEFIQRQAPGQSILSSINFLPGVTFTNSDAYGSAGGTIRIRGFGGNRIALMLDGMPLNDAGTYAIFSGRQLDPELIDGVSVTYGQADVDSPAASALGGTIAYRTRLPGRDLGLRLAASIGEESYRRGFIMVDSGEWWDGGPRAFVSYSNTRYDWFRGPGEIYKQQWNARIYYPIGGNGDFVSIAGHYNRNRNNLSRNPSFNDLRTTVLAGGQVGILGTAAVPAASPTAPVLVGDYDDRQWEAIRAFNYFDTCTLASPNGNGGVQNDDGGPLPNGSGAQLPGGANNIANTSSCANYAGLRINPSNSRSLRASGRFTLLDGLTVTGDASYQSVLASIGGTAALFEGSFRARGGLGPSPGAPSLPRGFDFNGDRDQFNDNVRFYTPDTTNTHRFTATGSLIWDINDDHRLRVAYTYDRARYHQTGAWSYLDPDGDPQGVFGGPHSAPVLTAIGYQIREHERTAIMLLNQIAGQYVGRFFNDRLRIELGLRVPFFRRDVETFCLTQASDGLSYCSTESVVYDTFPISSSRIAAYDPFAARYSYSAVLPDAGMVYDFGGGFSAFARYARGISPPGADILFRAPVVSADPETTNAYDLGVRYIRGSIQAAGALWKIDVANRVLISQASNAPITIDMGSIHAWGADASIAWRPIPAISLLALASYNHSRLQQNERIFAFSFIDCGSATDPASIPGGCAQSAGKRVPDTPDWQFGGRAQLYLGPFTVGVQAKWTGRRAATDDNRIFVDDYAIVDADVRFDLGAIGLPDSYAQLNATNLANAHYFGNISPDVAFNPIFSVGAPRTFMATLNLAWHAGR